MSTGRPTVPRFGHGSRVPGWDEAVDLTKDSGGRPRPGDDAGARRAARRDRGGDGQVPGPPLGRDPGAPRGPGGARLVLARGDRPGRDRDAADPGLPDLGGDLLRHARDRTRGRAHDVYVCTNISCSLLGADELFEAMLRAAAGDETIHVRSFECLGACDIAPMASVNGEYVGPLDARRRRQDRRGPARRATGARPTSSSATALRRPRRRRRRRGVQRPEHLTAPIPPG